MRFLVTIKSAEQGVKRTLLFLLTFFVFLGCYSQKQLISSEGSILMNDPVITKPMYEAEAYQMAVNNAIDHAFGSSVFSNYERTTYTEMQGRSVAAHLDVRNNYLNTYPNGVWIKDKSVAYDQKKDNSGNWWMICHVTGYAKRIETTEVSFIAKTLDGMDHAKDQTFNYYSEEQGYLYFKSAMNGYLLCFYDDIKTIQRCIPYNASSEQYIAIENNKEYLFFSPENADYGISSEDIDEIEFYTDQAVEYNQFYIIFSTEPMGAYFIDEPKDLGNGYRSFQNMSRSDFHHWLQENRIRNPEMQVQIIGISIRK